MEKKDITTEMIEKLLAEGNQSCDPGVRHNPAETLQRNAGFLIESSEKNKNYDEMTILRMKAAYYQGDYNQVIELAYLYDREQRPDSPTAKSFSPTKFVKNIIRFLTRDSE